MKTFLILVAVFGLRMAVADDADFAKHKAEILSKIDKHIEFMQEHKTCVQNAADKAALKKCHKEMKKFHHEMEEEHEGKIHEMKEKAKEKMDKVEDKIEEKVK